MIIHDQLGRQIKIESPPKRIVSLVPSQTELLHYLGLEEEVVGITKFCVHPKTWFLNKKRIGGTKNINLKTLRGLYPDLIIANKEENDQSQIGSLAREFPIYISDIVSIQGACKMIADIGEITHKGKRANELVADINHSFGQLRKSGRGRSVLYLIWQKPFMAAGRNTFIDDLISRCGFVNIIKEERYPIIDKQQIQLLNPEFIFLSSEPFPFNDQHQKEIQKIHASSRVMLTDGEFFSWYGPRLKEAVRYFNTFINF